MEIFGDHVTDAGLRVLAATQARLHELRIFSAHHVTDAGVASLIARSPALKELELEDMEQVSDATRTTVASELKRRGGSLWW